MTDLAPTTPMHDKDMARDFLTGLDPSAGRFTFQFFGDGGPGRYAEIFHGTLDEVWTKVQALNTPERRVGVFVTINETDFNGRRSENIVRPRALFADADSNEQITRAMEVIEARGATPSMIVESGRGRHFYWVCPDIAREQFSSLQKGLIDKLGTDKAITDLPRVMRLPGTLHLKDPTKPRLVKLCRTNDSSIRRWTFSELVEKLKLDDSSAISGHSDPIKVSPKFAAALANVPSTLGAGLEHDSGLLDPGPCFQESGCPWLRRALATGGKDYSQPEWNLKALACTFMENGKVLFHQLSDKYPKYRPDKTDQLWDRKLREREASPKLGWPSCSAIRKAGSRDCQACPHWGKLEFPLDLALPTRAAGHPGNPLPVGVTTVKFRDRDRSRNPRPSLANAVIAIRALGITARYDLFHHRIKVTYKGNSKTIREGLLTDDTVSAIRSLINNSYRIDCGDSNTLAAIKEIASDNAYDPVLDMLDECQSKWDGVKRIDSWVIDYLGCKDTPLNRAIGRLVLIAACRRAREPGCKFDSITVLEGVEGTSKSTAIRILAGDENFSDQSIIGASDKEVQEQLDGVWMHENADLAGMRRADVEHVKAFASRQVDRARPAYGRVREDRPRRSIEWGTTNNKAYLLSQTGNRRFWPLETGKIDMEALKRDREQLLGEAATYEAAGESITLRENLWGDAREAQEQRRAADPWEDILTRMPDGLVHKSGDGFERVSSADVLYVVLDIPKAQQTSAHAQRLALAMERVGWSRNPGGRVTIDGKPVRGYIRPATPTSQTSKPKRLKATREDTGVDENDDALDASIKKMLTDGPATEGSPRSP